MEDPLLKLSEVGRLVNRSQQTVRRWLNDGLLEYVRLPNGLFAVRQSAVQRFIGGSALGRK